MRLQFSYQKSKIYQGAVWPKHHRNGIDFDLEQRCPTFVVQTETARVNECLVSPSRANFFLI